MRCVNILTVLGLSIALLSAYTTTKALEGAVQIDTSGKAGTAPVPQKTFQERQHEEANRPVNWHTRFTFEGQVRPGPYTVDPHVWVYTKEFAERFGMPKEWISEELKGVEAAAWRKTKTGYVTCGWGGKKEACKEEDAAVLELYLDTRKVNLPWASWSKEADQMQLHWWTNSQRFLTSQQCERRREPSRGSLSNNWDDERSCIYYATRKPLSDPSSESEVGIFVKGIGYSGQGNMAGVGAYDKHAYPNLAWIQISYMRPVGLYNAPEVAVITFETRTAPLGKTLRKFHEILLPADFDRRVKSILDDQRETERQFHKNAVHMK